MMCFYDFWVLYCCFDGEVFLMELCDCMVDLNIVIGLSKSGVCLCF